MLAVDAHGLLAALIGKSFEIPAQDAARHGPPGKAGELYGEHGGLILPKRGARRKARDGELLFGTVDTWLIWKLTKGEVHVTDQSNASRTMLMDLGTGEWGAGLLDVFGVPRAMLPDVLPIWARR